MHLQASISRKSPGEMSLAEVSEQLRLCSLALVAIDARREFDDMSAFVVRAIERIDSAKTLLEAEIDLVATRFDLRVS